MPLTSESAQLMISASHDKARELGVAISTAIIDADGNLFAFGRMERAHWLTISVSQAKAYTGSMLRRDGEELQKMRPELFPALAAIQGRGLLPNPSVTTLREGNRVIAGIGCSGATNEAEDKECAFAARDAFTT